MRVKIIDIVDSVDGYGQGTAITFEWRDEEGNGPIIRRDAWHTDNASGVDFYTESGDSWGFPGEDAEGELLEAFFEEVLEEYWKAHEKWVNPAIETAVQTAIAASECMGEEPKYAGLSVDML